MSTAAHYPHIVVDAAGIARIDKTRYKVLHLATEHCQHGWTAEELLRQHPGLAAIFTTCSLALGHSAMRREPPSCSN